MEQERHTRNVRAMLVKENVGSAMPKKNLAIYGLRIFG
jgi:hypothetical protein